VRQVDADPREGGTRAAARALGILADDIKQHGLLHPIVLDADGVLVDGRNRLRACEIAEVEPQFTSLNGHDPTAFIMSANVARRQMTKGAIAMVVAVAYPDKHQGTSSIIEEVRMVHAGRLSTARSVIEYAPWLVDQVIGGKLSLEKAAVTAQEKRAEANSAEAKMAELRRVSPEIADMVVEERLTLAEAHATLVERRNHAARLSDARNRCPTVCVHRPIAQHWTRGATADPERAGCLPPSLVLPRRW
jgi:hypothetical protein